MKVKSKSEREINKAYIYKHTCDKGNDIVSQ